MSLYLEMKLIGTILKYTKRFILFEKVLQISVWKYLYDQLSNLRNNGESFAFLQVFKPRLHRMTFI